jgi:hypothetical protein
MAKQFVSSIYCRDSQIRRGRGGKSLQSSGKVSTFLAHHCAVLPVPGGAALNAMLNGSISLIREWKTLTAHASATADGVLGDD